MDSSGVIRRSLLLGSLGWIASARAGATGSTAGSAPAACPPLLQHTFARLQDEKPVNLCSFAGKVLLVVNTASECGFTPQYEGLERLYAGWRDRGLVVLGFPSNDFGGQEPGNNAKIAEFCQNQFGVRFPMFAKTVVKAGARGQNPFYAQLVARSGSTPKWNFHKYLVDRRGERVIAFSSLVDPGDRKLVKELELLINAN